MRLPMAWRIAPNSSPSSVGSTSGSGALSGTCASAARMSCFTILPPGPVPEIGDGSRPFGVAILRARGEILSRRGEGSASTSDAAGSTAFSTAGWPEGTEAAIEDASAFSASGSDEPRSASVTCSPGAPIRAITSPKGTRASTGWTIRSSVPEQGASTSMMALSVSTPSRISPSSMGSFSCLFHSAIRADPMSTENLGILT